MVPAIFLLTFKVKGHGFRMHGTNNYVMIFGRVSVNIRSKPVHSERIYFKAIFMKNSNDLDLPTRKVKVI